MSVGIQNTKQQIDSTAGLFVQLMNVFDQISRMQTFLLATPDATLTSAPYNYTAGEVAQLKSAFSDHAQLIAIYQGAQSLAVAKDFRTFSKPLIGTGL